MTATVFDLAEKAKALSLEERKELMEWLEDLEDNALANDAIQSGDFITEAEHKL